MDDERYSGVTEARFALTVLICLLVAIGYVVLLRLGSANESTVELRSPAIASQATTPIGEDEPQVLTVEPEGTTVPRTTLRPEPQPHTPRGAATEPDRYQVVPAGSIEIQRR